MIDKRLLKLVPKAMRHVIATVIWKWIGLAGNIALCFVIAQLLAALAEKSSLEALAFPSLILIAFALIACVISIRYSSQESFAASQDIKQTL